MFETANDSRCRAANFMLVSLFILLSVCRVVAGTDNEKCGVREGYFANIIKGGFFARRYEWPWTAHLKVVVVGNNGSHIAADCGGSVVHAGWIVSAAHCFVANRIVEVIVTVGVTDIYGSSEASEMRQVRKLDPRDIIIHRQFDYRAATHDVALLRDDVNLIANGAQAWVAGWGVTEQGQFSSKLLATELRTLPLHSCGKMTNHIICARGLARDACRGDSGGPLVTDIGGQFHQIGIVSYGRQCSISGDGDLTGMYARIASHCGFFESETDGDVICS